MSFSFFKPKARDYADVAREIRGKAGRSLSKKHKMEFVGVSGGMMDSVYMIGLRFQMRRPMEREEARMRLVDCAEELIEAVNSNEEIRPHLQDFPFTTKNIEVVIFISDETGRGLYDPDISVVSLGESDDIYYYTNDQSNPNKYKHQYRESYQEARTKVKESWRNWSKELFNNKLNDS
jgi:hypothetical protein